MEKTTTVRISRTLHEKLKNEKRKTGVSINRLLEFAVNKLFNGLKRGSK